MRKIMRALSWPWRKYKLEKMVTIYVWSTGRVSRDREARRQARAIIMDSPDSPM